MDQSFFTVQGLKVAYYERPGKNPTLFFVHGNSSNAHAFEDVWKQPALQGYHLVSLDLPGHGKSDQATDVNAYTMSSLGKLIAESIEAKGLRDVILVGHSIGGHIALTALNFTDRVAGIALAGTAPVKGAHDLSKAYVISEPVQVGFKAECADAEIRDFCHNAVYRTENAQTLARSFRATDARFREQMGLELGRHFGAGTFKSEIGLLEASALPVCLIHGEKERIVNVDYLNSLASLKLFKNGIQLIRDAGHCTAIEAPEECSSVLADFVSHVIPVRS